jgi:alpha-beta hydrolase superfamily lysophospholipase
MNKASISTQTIENLSIVFYRWDNVIQPKGIVQIVHGMAEHSGRYSRLASFLNSKGWIVLAQDLLGHGGNIKSQPRGHWEAKGWEKNISIIESHSKSILSEYKNLPLFVLGQGLGSYLLQDFLNDNSNKITGAILAGTNGSPGFLTKILYWIARIEKIRKNGSSTSDLIDRLTSSSWNQNFASSDKYAWLTHDHEVLQEYKQDPLCGFSCSCSLWVQVLYHTIRINKFKNQQSISKDIPLLILSGIHDPIGEQGVGVHRLLHEYIHLGLNKLSYSFYPKFRHELFTGKDSTIVYEDLHTWLEQNS